MKKLICVLAGVSMLGGCAGLTPGSLSTDTTNFIQEVDSITSAACSFIPSAETIAGLATAGSAGATSALTLASSIAAVVCGAVKTATGGTTTPSSVALRRFRHVRLAGGRRGVVLPSVNGVQITGYFISDQ